MLPVLQAEESLHWLRVEAMGSSSMVKTQEWTQQISDWRKVALSLEPPKPLSGNEALAAKLAELGLRSGQ